MRAKLCLVLGVLGTGWTWHATAFACSCLLASEQNSYELVDYALRGQPIASFSPREDQLWYLVWISGPAYKGCLREHSVLWVRTEPDEASCGVALRPGVEYLLKGEREGRAWGLPVLYTTLCIGTRAISDMSAADLAFWSTRERCCNGQCTCAASERVACLADPCAASSCSAEGAQCRANDCGGCNAEWLGSDGLRVCLDTGAPPTAAARPTP